MSDMYDSDELVDLHAHMTDESVSEKWKKYVPSGFRDGNDIARTIRFMAAIIEGEYPYDSEEAEYARCAVANLKISRLKK